MIDLARGIKAGIIAGIIYGIINGIIGSLIIGLQIESNSVYSGYLPSYLSIFSIIWGIFSGAFIGFIVGLIYAVLYDKLPGTMSMVKAITLTLLFWFVFSVILGSMIFMFSQSSNYQHYFESSLLSSLITLVIFGAALGLLYDKFKPVIPTCPQCHREIPRDARVCPYCGTSLQTLQQPTTPST